MAAHPHLDQLGETLAQELAMLGRHRRINTGVAMRIVTHDHVLVAVAEILARIRGSIGVEGDDQLRQLRPQRRIQSGARRQLQRQRLHLHTHRLREYFQDAGDHQRPRRREIPIQVGQPNPIHSGQGDAQLDPAVRGRARHPHPQ
ncbi:hypothetical protein [Gordonia sp. NPDC003422]